VALCTVIASLAFSAAPALAAVGHNYLCQITGTSPGSASECHAGGSATPGGLSDPWGITISNGNLWVADPGNAAVDEFDSTGAFVSQQTGAGQFSGSYVRSVAVNDSTQYLYVADSGPDAVDVFDNTGVFVTQWNGSSTPSGSFGGGYVYTAVDNSSDASSGDVYVTDSSHGVIDKLDPSGNPVSFSGSASYVSGSQITGTPSGSFSNLQGGITVDSSGNIYAVDQGNDVVDEFDQTGTFVRQFTGAGTPSGSFGSIAGVGVDDATGNVYIVDSADNAVDEFSSTGTFVGQLTGAGTPAGSFNTPQGVAVDASGDVYVTDGGNHVIDKFGPDVILPDVTTGQATNIGPSSATLNGTVNPDGIQLTDCRFDYVDDAHYNSGAANPYSAGQTAPCVPDAASIPADSNDHGVSADISGLTAGTTYHFRLEASNANGANLGADVTFQTPPPPSIDSANVANLTSSSADLTAQINPNGSDTTYHFQWGTSTSYGNTVPVPDADIGSETNDVSVSQHIAGLVANTTYHWRVVATNGAGTTTSADHTFIYDTSGGGLPDNRAYELVTPVAKDGATVGLGIFIAPAFVAADGSSAIATSIQCFAGSSGCNATRQTEGDPYAFTRTSSGWVTTPLAPSATQFAANTFWGASADTGAALFSMPTPPGGEDDFYLRTPAGSFEDIGPAYPPADGAQGTSPMRGPFFRTADLSHLVYALGNSSLWLWSFDSTLPNNGAPNTPSTYEYVGTGNSQPVLVGVSGGPGSTDLISICGTRPGNGNSTDHGISADGSIVYFTAIACSSGSGANAGIPVPAAELYARIDGTLPGAHTVFISGRSPADCTTSACQNSAPSGANFEGASTDGSKVFFTSTQQLTDSASEDSDDSATVGGCQSTTTGTSGCNLYLYDFTNQSGYNLIDVSAGDTSGLGPEVQGVMAISADGSHAYFIAQGVLTANPNAQGQTASAGADNLYVFERDASFPGGHLTFIASLSGFDSNEWQPGAEEANVTPDGRFLVFTSHSRLTPDDASTTGAAQVFEYDAQTGQLARISIGNDGFNDNGNAGVGSCSTFSCPTDGSIVPAFDGLGVSPGRGDPTMSDDGSFVFFESPVGLTPQALDDVQIGTDIFGNPTYAQNVYEYHDGHVYLISDGEDTATEGQGGRSDVQFYGSDATGANVFFSSSDQLVPEDTDFQLNIYDARICTVADPCIQYPSPPAPCEGDACQGALTPSPPVPTAASVTFTGPGNITGAASARVRVLSRVVHGSTFFLRVRMPAGGSVTVSGAEVKQVTRVMADGGIYRVRVSLTANAKRALARRHRLTVTLRAAYAPAGGGAVSVAHVRLTVEPAIVGRARRAKDARALGSDVRSAR
jgi:DNA-binding beta-propeller fold protein YncE